MDEYVWDDMDILIFSYSINSTYQTTLHTSSSHLVLGKSLEDFYIKKVDLHAF